MSAPEKLFHDWLVRGAPREWHIQRIETGATNGVPVLSIAIGPGMEVWIELKGDKPKPLLRKEQVAWSARRVCCGGKVVVLHRKRALPWHLYDLSQPTKYEFVGDKMAIVSAPTVSGFAILPLASALADLWKHNQTSQEQSQHRTPS